MEIGIDWYFRTPIGKKRGIWASSPPEELMRILLEKVASHQAIPDEILLASASTTGGNAARYALLSAGLPESVPGYLLDAQCLGSAQALSFGWAKLKAGLAKTIWVGGMESASLAPMRGFHPRDPRYSPEQPMYQTALFFPGGNQRPMVEQMQPLLAEFSEQEMTAWGRASKKKAWMNAQHSAIQALRYPAQPDQLVLSPEEDERVRSKWQSRFPNQMMHPWNCAQEADGAALLGLTTQPCDVIIKQVVTIGGSPQKAALTCVEAVNQLLGRTELTALEIDLWEIHEAFSMKPLAILKKWSINPSKVNIFGGNLAYGHPFGASGAIGIMHLAAALRDQKKRYGVFTMSAAGGLGIAILLEYKR